MVAQLNWTPAIIELPASVCAGEAQVNTLGLATARLGGFKLWVTVMLAEAVQKVTLSCTTRSYCPGALTGRLLPVPKGVPLCDHWKLLGFGVPVTLPLRVVEVVLQSRAVVAALMAACGWVV